ncbi:hypothetical protein [Nostoc sp.]|uniref:hypothetical protein n=1 Tax=Nostoc sp. TaxID=1180 RepID=UPI002FF77796
MAIYPKFISAALSASAIQFSKIEVGQIRDDRQDDNPVSSLRSPPRCKIEYLTSVKRYNLHTSSAPKAVSST